MKFQLDSGVEVLATTPAVLDALLRGKSESWLQSRRTPDAFTPMDVLGHLIYGEETDWIPRVRWILDNRDTKAFEPFDRFGFQAWMAGKSVDELLDAFARARVESLQALRAFELSEEHLDFPGKHPEFGHVTLRNHLAAWAVHDLGHIAQIVKTMAWEYREAVGPWRAYTTILD